MKEKKGFFLTVLHLILILLMTAPLIFSGTNPLKVTNIQENLYVITGMEWDVNVVVLVTESGVLVVDSGNNPAEGKWILERIREITAKPVKTLVLTHYHFDHSLGLLAFPKDMNVIAHTNCAKNIHKFGEQRLVMGNYACGFNQSETGKYFE